MKKLAINDVFRRHEFVAARFGRYVGEPWMIPAIGLKGCINLVNRSVLHLEMTDDAWTEAKRFCLNGVIEKIRFHVSARMNRPDTVLVCVSDLTQEFEFCQIPFVSSADELIKGVSV